MKAAVDIGYWQLSLVFILLAVPFLASWFLKLGIVKQALISVVRMTVQLLLIGFFLDYIFELNSTLLTFGWFLLMVATATVTVIKRSKLRFRLLILPVVSSILVAALGILFYFVTLIIGLENIFEAKYFIAIGGMLLGNTLRGNIIGLTTFYQGINRDQDRFAYHLSVGASRLEAVVPYLRKALNQAFAPLMATMATTGIVSLPGMMTGQLIGGSSAMTSVKYQIAIMISIFVVVTVSTGLTILLTLRFTFRRNDMMRQDIFVGNGGD